MKSIKMVKKYTKKHFQADIDKLESFINENQHNESEQDGGKRFRHFKLIEADQKELNIGYVKISEAGSPLSAARKLFKSLCHHKNMSGDDKLKVKSTFTIQETTQDSKKKIYGPYVGHWKKLNEKEKNDASRAGIIFNMRSVVKLVSAKGGKKRNQNKKNKETENEISEDEEYEQKKKNQLGG